MRVCVWAAGSEMCRPAGQERQMRLDGLKAGQWLFGCRLEANSTVMIIIVNPAFSRIKYHHRQRCQQQQKKETNWINVTSTT